MPAFVRPATWGRSPTNTNPGFRSWPRGVRVDAGRPEAGSAARRGPLPTGGFSATEDFTGSNGAAWPAQWTAGSTGTGASATIQGNKGRLSSGAQGGYNGSSRVSRRFTIEAMDVDISGTWTPDANEPYATVNVRSDSALNGEFGYSLTLNKSGTLKVERVLDYFNVITLGSAFSFAASSNTTYGFRFRVVGHSIQARVWSGTEPSTWQVDVIDDSISKPGAVGLATFCGAASINHSVDWDDIVVTDGAPAGGTEQTSDASLSATGAMSAAGTAERPSGASLAATGSLSGAGAASRASDASLTATGSLSAAGAVTRPADASLTATGSMSGTTALERVSGASLSASASMSASGSVTRSSGAPLAATGSLSGAGAAERSSASSLAATGSLSSSGAAERPSTASLAATGALSTAGTVERISSVTLAATGSLTASGDVTPGAGSGATLTAVVGGTASGYATRFADSSAVVTGSLTATGARDATTGAALTAVAELDGSGYAERSAGAELGAVASLVGGTTVVTTRGKAAIGTRKAATAAVGARAVAGHGLGSRPFHVATSATRAVPELALASRSVPQVEVSDRD